MENNYYQIYIDSVLQLAASVVIKSSDTADGVNTALYMQYGPNAYDPLNPRSWRYYLNLAGRYHSADEVMTVTSMDTLQTIQFTRENLQIHTATAKAYEYGSVHYLELVDRYPTQRRLIMGILYPADLDVAVESPDGTILSYPPHLVEDWELTLIQRLQQWIYSYLVRWDNVQFKLSDNLYSAAVHAVMYANLVPAIICFRKASCKTNEVHSYHIRQYLASNGMLDVYIRFLTRKQQLFLYRNISYIQRNTAKREVFDWLIDNILTQRSLPLAAYEMRHDVSAMPSTLTPELTFLKIPLNTEQNHDLRDHFTLTEVMDKEDPLAPDNPHFRDQEQERSDREMKNSLGNRLNTKLLESSMTDYSGSEHFTLADTLLYHWAYLSAENYYRAIVGFDNPVNGEFVPLTAKQAFEFFVYLTCRSYGVTLERLPPIIAKRVAPVTKATLADVMSVVNPKKVPESFGQQMVDLMPSLPVMISVDSFYEQCVKIWRASMTQYGYVCADGTSTGRGMKYNLMSRCWGDVSMQLGVAGQTYHEWFIEHNINIDEFRDSDYLTVAAKLLETATGVGSINAITLADIQRALIQLMAQLGSYSVQYVTDINTGPIIDAPTSIIRPDEWQEKKKFGVEIITAVDVIARCVKYKIFHFEDIAGKGFGYKFKSDTRFKSDYEIKVKPGLTKFSHVFHKRLPVGFDVNYDIGDLPPNPRRVTPVLGIGTYLSLTLEEQQSIPDFWHLDQFNIE